MEVCGWILHRMCSGLCGQIAVSNKQTHTFEVADELKQMPPAARRWCAGQDKSGHWELTIKLL